MTHVRALPLVLSIGAVACSRLLQPDERPLHGAIVLSRSAAEATTPIVGTYRSVVDSVAISLTTGGAVQAIGQRFAANESSVSIPVTLSAGIATLTADILSNNLTRLFSGSSSPNIAANGFSIDMPLAALTPVLVVFPDSLKVDSTRVSTVTLRFASITVHNSGTDSLAWSVDVVSASPTNLCGFGCTMVPSTGKLAKNGEVNVIFTMPMLFASGAPISTSSIDYLFTSKEGTIALQWRYSAGP